MKRLGDDVGQVSILTVLCLTCLLGFVAFAVDVGILLRAKQVAQTAADSAVMAAVAEFNYGDMTAAANADAVQNGVPASAVKVNYPPLYGPNAGKSNYVEVIISQSQPTFFMKMFKRSSMTVAARAVATTVPSPNCVYTLGSAGTDIGGNLTLPNCSILVDSSSSNALNLTGSGSISAKSIGIVGGYTKTGSGTISPTPVTGMTAVSDPLSLTAPAFNAGSCNAGISYTDSTSHTVTGPSTPGGTICYNGFSNTGSGSVTFPAGTYIINGDFKTTGSGNLSGTGVTFYLPSGSNKFSVTGSGDLTLSSPTSGTYSGILFYQDSGDTQTMSITASGASNLSGIVYAPRAELDLTGSNSAAFNTDIVVGSMNITGSINLSYYVPLAGSSPLSSPRLAE
jgi:hypothetical protein